MKCYDIRAFGAQPGSESVQTIAIQSAIDTCFLAGGGEVLIPDGLFYTGGLRLRSNVTLRLTSGAHLKGTRNPADYFAWREDRLEPFPQDAVTDTLWSPAAAGEQDRARDNRFISLPGSAWNNGLIRAYRANNIAIVGEKGARIDGSDCFDERGEEHYRGPHLINLWECENVTLRGFTTVDSANWAMAIFRCGNLLVEDVVCLAGHDGVHAQSCDNLIVRNCEFYTGDDCVAGFDNRNVLVTGCVMNTACSALRFGGSAVRVENCRFFGPARYVFRGSLTDEEKRTGAPARRTEGHRYNMLSIFTYYADFTFPIRDVPGAIVIRNCTAENVDRFLHYNYSGNETWQKGCPLADIAFEHVRATGVSMPLTAYGDPDVPITLRLTDCDVAFEGDRTEGCFLKTAHYRRVTLDRVGITGLEGQTLVRSWGGDGELELNGVEAGIAPENFLRPAETEFVCKSI